MGQKIVIEPVTRIEGHAKVTVHLDDQGEVAVRAPADEFFESDHPRLKAFLGPEAKLRAARSIGASGGQRS